MPVAAQTTLAPSFLSTTRWPTNDAMRVSIPLHHCETGGGVHILMGRVSGGLLMARCEVNHNPSLLVQASATESVPKRNWSSSVRSSPVSSGERGRHPYCQVKVHKGTWL